MIGQLNLASQPFRNRTLPWTGAVVIASASIVALVLIVGAARQARAQADLVERDVQDLRAREQVLQKQAEEVRQSLTTEQRLVLDWGRGKNGKVPSQVSSPRNSAKSERALRETATRFRKALSRLADR